jgi:hypothetical protein
MNTLKKYGLVGLALAAAILATILVVSLASAHATAASITGTVELPGGGLLVPDGTLVWLLKPDQSVHGWAQVTTSTGAFDLVNVPPGNYSIRARPPEASGYTPSLMQPVVVLNAPVNVGTLYLTNPSITGTVYQPGGVTTAMAKMHVYAGPIQVEVRETLPDGAFAIGGLRPGTYRLAAEPLPNEWWWWSQVSAIITDNVTSYVTLTLRDPDVKGWVVDGKGAPVQDAIVHAATHNTGSYGVDVTGLSGKFAIDSLSGSTAIIAVEPPFYHPGLLPTSTTVTLPHHDPITLTLLSSPKIVTGTVTTNNPLTPIVENALVMAHRIGASGQESTTTDAHGRYTLTLAPGLWALTVRPISTSVPLHWVYPRPPQLLHFDDTPIKETKQLNFKVLTADAQVTGAVEMPGGGAPAFTVTVGLFTDEGIGVKQDIDASGLFTFHVPHGPYKVDVRVASPMYAAPPVEPIFAAPLTTTVIPTVTLIARDAAITGALTFSNTPVANVPVVAWNSNTHAAFQTRSGPDGVYMLAVYTGTWLVRPAPLPNQPYLYASEPQEVELTTLGQIVGDIDFQLLYADATIHGVLLKPDGAIANDAHGWGQAVNTADSTIRNGAPVRHGAFDILVPGDATYTATLRLPDGGRYVYTGTAQTTPVGAGETVTLTFELVEKNARFVGALWDRRNDMGVAGVPGRVWAWDDDLWLSTEIDTGNGHYSLPVPAGLWGLNYDIPQDSGWVKLAGARYYGVDAAPPPQVANLPVARKDGTLTGTVSLPDGTPAVGAVAVADGLSGDIWGLTVRAPVGADGAFSMSLPSGRYVVRATRCGDETLINPVAKHVHVPHDGAANVTLQYRQPDAWITGQVTLITETSVHTGSVAVFAWTEDGGYNKTTVELGGVYSMPVISRTLWHLAAVYETANQYWKARACVLVTDTTATRDLVLLGPYYKPAPISVLFDPSEEQRIELADGTSLYIPAGAIPASGNTVLLNITPLAGAPHHQNGDVLGLTYAFEAFDADGQPITEHFNQDVLIVLHYDPLELYRLGLTERRLKPAYFSTSTNSWTFPDSFIVDTQHNTISMLMDHFTRYGVLGTDSYTIFLPVIQRN